MRATAACDRCVAGVREREEASVRATAACDRCVAGVRARRLAVRVGGVVAVIGLLLAGCSSTPGPTPTHTPVAGGSTPTAPTKSTPPATARYALTKPMCDVADLSALKAVFPKTDKPLLDVPDDCGLGMSSATLTVSVGVEASVWDDTATAKNYLDTGRRLSRTPVTSLPGVGTDAYVVSTADSVEVHSYDGNLDLTVSVDRIRTTDHLPAGLATRLAQVSTATYQRLAS